MVRQWVSTWFALLVLGAIGNPVGGEVHAAPSGFCDLSVGYTAWRHGFSGQGPGGQRPIDGTKVAPGPVELGTWLHAPMASLAGGVTWSVLPELALGVTGGLLAATAPPGDRWVAWSNVGSHALLHVGPMVRLDPWPGHPLSVTASADLAAGVVTGSRALIGAPDNVEVLGLYHGVLGHLGASFGGTEGGPVGTLKLLGGYLRRPEGAYLVPVTVLAGIGYRWR